MRYKSVIKALFLTLIFFGCKPNDDTEGRLPLSDIPSIILESTDPVEINQFDNITFKISFLDGNGDIGTEDADDHSLEIIDNRDLILHTFHIPPQTPSSGISVSGVFIIELENVILLDQSNESEVITFDIRLKDREENWSAVVTSPTVTINK